MPTLLLLFLIPFVASVIAFLMPDISTKNFKRFMFVLSLAPLAILLSQGTSWVGAHIDYPWLPALSIHFHLSIDSLSLVFLYLTAIIIPYSILAMPSKDLTHPHTFFGLVLFLQGLLIGFFTARDLALFTLFWEAMLLPLYFIITLWGGPKRENAALKFLIYMIAGSALMVAAVLGLYFSSMTASAGGTFNLDALSKVSSAAPYAGWIFAIFALAFAVKTPLFPFHAWLPDAYCQAPTSGTILLSAILSKAGIYGFIRIGMEQFPKLMVEWSPLLIGLAIAGVLYGGMAAWGQNDFKRLIAYSSFSHVNFILVGLFVWNETAHAGGILQALNHGITIAALFLVASWLETRLGTTDMNGSKGLARYLPYLCWVTLFFVVASVALPGLNNFVGEFMIFFGLFGYSPWLTALLGLSIILSVIYMLRWMQKVYFEPPSAFKEGWLDIKAKHFAIAAPLAAIIIWIGVYPTPVLKQIMPAAQKIEALANLEHKQ